MAKIDIPYGSKQLVLDNDADILDVEGEAKKGVSTSDSFELIKEALDHPAGTKRLRDIIASKPSPKIVIIVDDHTRDPPTEIMLDALLDAIGGEYKENITVLVACGTHEAPAEEDLERIVGKHVSDITIKMHECDANDLVLVGTTSRGTPVRLNRAYVDADVRIVTGDISLHYYAGFGGGRKSILPGISSRETIQKNHALLVDEQARTANLDHNPVHLDMSEAAGFIPPDFVLNIVTTGNRSVVAAYAGELDAVFQKGVDFAQRLFCRTSPILYDVLIVSAGGFPKDRNLYQASKAIENCYRIVRPGGVLLLVAECRDGIGDSLFERWMNKYATLDEAEAAIKREFQLGGHKAFYLRQAMRHLVLATVSDIDPQLLYRWKIIPYKSVADALLGFKKDKVRIGIVKKGLDAFLVPALDKG